MKKRVLREIVNDYNLYRVVLEGNRLFIEISAPYFLLNIRIDITEFWCDIAEWKTQAEKGGEHMEDQLDQNVEMIMEDAFKSMRQAFALLSSPSVRSRENSLVLTKLEEAMMWCNKDRTIKGFLEPNKDTHVSQAR